jgi:cytosine/adenosine deaminase-related metal-dependent hydrolase
MPRIAFPVLLCALVARAALAAEPAPPPGEEFIRTVAGGPVQPARPAPARRPDEGEGPFARLVIRGATLVDGTGAPPVGPVDVVVEGGRIAVVRSVGHPGVPIREQGRPARGEREIDAAGMFLLPGFVDAHAHVAYPLQGALGETPPAEYVYKLWLAHGITTVREVGSGNGLAWTIAEKRRSAAREIVAPRILAYPFFPTGIETPGAPQTPAAARQWVEAVAAAGADGIKFLGAPPEIMQAALARAQELGLATACHHAQPAVARMNVLDTSGWGLTSMEHWYGLPEALFTDRTVQDFPVDYDYNDESHRFGQAGRLWAQAAEPGSARWTEVLRALRERDFTLVPTFTIYEASRDLLRERRAEWHDDYTLPTLWRWFQPNREAHGSYWFDWTTPDEIAWKRNYAKWMRFVNDYKNLGGRVAAGSDAGFIYKLFGFAYVRELELLQEAGFHPLEVVRAATLDGAELLGLAGEIGSVEPGKRADLVLVEGNPLANFKLLYGTGHFRLDDATGQPTHVRGLRTVIRDGVLYDAERLLAEVRKMVAEARARDAGAAQP